MSMWGIVTALASKATGPPKHTRRTWGGGWGGLKPDGAREASVLLRVIVLQADLQLDRLHKLPVRALVPMQQPLHCLAQGVAEGYCSW